MATEYKLTDKNLNNITVRRKQLISRFSASSLKYVRVLKQDILHKFRSSNKILNFKNSNLDFFKKPIRSRYPSLVYKYPKWFQFKLVFRPNLSESNFVYSVYNQTRKTRSFISNTVNKSFNTVPFLALSKLNKNSNKYFLVLQSTSYRASLRRHNFKNDKWKMFSIVQSLNTIAGFSADYKRRDLEYCTGLSIYNKLGFFKWFFINTMQSKTYLNQRFMSIAMNSSLYKISINQVSRCFFLIQKVIIFKKRRELQIFNVIKRISSKHSALSHKFSIYKNLLKKIKKIKRNSLDITYLSSFLNYLKAVHLNLFKLKQTINKLNQFNGGSNLLFVGFYLNKFFNFMETNRFFLLKLLKPTQFKKLYLLMRLRKRWIGCGLTSASLSFQKAVYSKIWYKYILRLYRQLSLMVFLERRRLKNRDFLRNLKLYEMKYKKKKK